MRNLLLSLFFALWVTPTPAQTPASGGASLPFTLKPLGHGIYSAIDNS